MVVQIMPIDFRNMSGPGNLYGRNFALKTRAGVIEEKMDRQLRLYWIPRRFSFSGRHFVWRIRDKFKVGLGPNGFHETVRT